MSVQDDIANIFANTPRQVILEINKKAIDRVRSEIFPGDRLEKIRSVITSNYRKKARTQK